MQDQLKSICPAVGTTAVPIITAAPHDVAAQAKIAGAAFPVESVLLTDLFPA
jgi:hypothetical protein